LRARPLAGEDSSKITTTSVNHNLPQWNELAESADDLESWTTPPRLLPQACSPELRVSENERASIRHSPFIRMSPTFSLVLVRSKHGAVVSNVSL
jgi:hypothetical protein